MGMITSSSATSTAPDALIPSYYPSDAPVSAKNGVWAFVHFQQWGAAASPEAPPRRGLKSQIGVVVRRPRVRRPPWPQGSPDFLGNNAPLHALPTTPLPPSPLAECQELAERAERLFRLDAAAVAASMELHAAAAHAPPAPRPPGHPLCHEEQVMVAMMVRAVVPVELKAAVKAVNVAVPKTLVATPISYSTLRRRAKHYQGRMKAGHPPMKLPSWSSIATGISNRGHDQIVHLRQEAMVLFPPDVDFVSFVKAALAKLHRRRTSPRPLEPLPAFTDVGADQEDDVMLDMAQDVEPILTPAGVPTLAQVAPTPAQGIDLLAAFNRVGSLPVPARAATPSQQVPAQSEMAPHDGWGFAEIMAAPVCEGGAFTGLHSGLQDMDCSYPSFLIKYENDDNRNLL